MTRSTKQIGYRRKKGAKKAHARSRSMPGNTGRSASTNYGTVGRDSDDTCGGDETPPVDVDDGNGKDEKEEDPHDVLFDADGQPYTSEADVYRRARDAAQLRPKKMDRRLKPETQWRIVNDNEWKRLVRDAYDTAAQVADELAQVHKENDELRAKIRELRSTPSALVVE